MNDLIKLPVRYGERGTLLDANGKPLVSIYAWSRNVKEKNDTLGNHIAHVLNNYDAIVKAAKMAKDACQDNIKAYAYKNEQALYEAFVALEAALDKAEPAKEIVEGEYDKER